MRYLSLFSGIEAATVAWEPLGWEAVAFCEVDEFPSAVLACRWPDVPNLGDITRVDWSDFNERYGKVDVIVGGSPCQSFSVAGKREGLSGESRLMFEYVRAVREVRPRYFVWENVPGALSSEKGEAFRQLLSEMDDLGYGLAWRVLDAQFFGVAQRRRRVFLVGSLGNQRASEILFEPDCMRWDYPSSREKRQDLTRAAQHCASEGRGGCLTPWDYQAIRIYSEDGPFATLMNGDGNGKTGLNRQSVLAKTYCLQGSMIGREDKNGPQGDGINEDLSFTLNTIDRHAVLAFDTTQITSRQNGNNPQFGDPCHPLCSAGHPPTIAKDGSAEDRTVRRLTPRECERLQGFPDDHTLIPYRGKPAENCPDSPRYKALGNSMAVPVMRWIGERIEMVDGK